MYGITSYTQTSYGDDGVVNVSITLTGVSGTGGVGQSTARSVVGVNPSGVRAFGQ